MTIYDHTGRPWQSDITMREFEAAAAGYAAGLSDIAILAEINGIPRSLKMIDINTGRTIAHAKVKPTPKRIGYEKCR